MSSAFIPNSYLWENLEKITMELIETHNPEISSNTYVDIEKIATSLNISIEKHEMENKKSGKVTISDNGCTMIINSKDCKTRQRFTIAHELGHYISYKYNKKTGTREDTEDGGKEIDGSILGFLNDNNQISQENKKNEEAARDDRSEMGINLEEIFANQFAASILIPKPLLITALQETSDIAILAEKFLVSRLAMQYRILNFVKS